MKKHFLLVLLFIICSVSSQSQGIEFDHESTFKQLLEKAKAENKIIFMDCYTSWCGPCKRLASQVFPQPAVGDYFNTRYINAKFDMEKGEGPEIASRYLIRAYPTLLWLDGNGKEVHKVVGGLEPEGLIAEAKSVNNPIPGLLLKMNNEYLNGIRDIPFLAEYLTMLSNEGIQYDTIFKEYLNKISTDELKEEKNTNLIYNLTNHIASPGIAYLMSNKSFYVQKKSAKLVDDKINSIAAKASNDAIKNNDPALFDAALNLLKKNGAKDSKETILKLSMDYFAKKGDWTNYDKTTSDYIKKYSGNSPSILNEAAWNYYINIDDESKIEKATKWAQKAVALQNNASNNTTLAYLYFKQKKLSEATKQCDYALITGKEKNENTAGAKALKESILKAQSK